MTFLFGLVIGFVIGWVVFNQPQWAKDLMSKIKNTFNS